MSANDTTHHSSGDRINVAFEALISAFRTNEPQRCMHWNHEMIGAVGDIRSLVNEYQRAKGSDDVAVAQYLKQEKKYQQATPKERKKITYDYAYYKDAPPINKKGLPKRKAGFIDQEHSIEYQIGVTMHELLNNVQDKNLSGSNREYILKCIKELANEMDGIGIVLDQGKTYANATTMPHTKHEEDPDLRQSEKIKNKGFFTRLRALEKNIKER